MTTIPDCLAAFSVAAMTNSPEAEDRGRAAIDAYLRCVDEEPRRRVAALHELHAAYLELALDSTAALAIKSDIEHRIAGLASGASGPGGSNRA
jgi:hypothetical protein